ncbi:hypothetical protein PVAP13_2KG398710 [Panicum virgatum]|uniref:Uncharacterized protein n=1 Tax=Panicum virgatum TaxID=38727 RepID=A0A8T0W3Z5_PANVG|nr:hypothetical protein PVAP13_2KG398710 [Panicum virgatum]
MIDPPRMHVTNMVLNHAKNPTDGPSDHFPWFRVLKRARRTTTLTTVAHGEDHLPLLCPQRVLHAVYFFLLPQAAPFYTRRIERTCGLWFLAFLGGGNREDSPGVGAGGGDQASPVAPAMNLSLMQSCCGRILTPGLTLDFGVH